MAVAAGSLWRTPLVWGLAGWLVYAVLVVVGAVPISELLGHWASVPWTVAFAGPFVLLAWSVVMVVRAPRRSWPAPLLVVAATAATVAVVDPLSDLGLRLNFLRHRGAYDRIVAEARAGQLVGRPAGNGLISGMRYGHEFIARPGPEGFVQFTWQAGDTLFFEVFHDEDKCPGRNKGRTTMTPARGSEPAMISLGYSPHLAGHYCLRSMIV